MTRSGTPPVALTIAGSDSGGGAGIQADLATFAALGVHGASAITAVTVQDTTGVHQVHHVPVEVVLAQVHAVVTDLRPTAVKTGMLGESGIVRSLGALAADGLLPQLVVDPVLVSTSGHRLAGRGVVASLREHLLPHADVITPNTDEAAVLLGCHPAASLEEQSTQARALLELGCTAVVVTGGAFARSPGGHGCSNHVQRTDVVATARGVRVLAGPEIDTRNDHGTGCTFASAIAGSLATGLPLDAAVQAARSFVQQALQRAASWQLGRGRGPVSHLGPRGRCERDEPDLHPGNTPTQQPTQSPTQTQPSTQPPTESRGEHA